MLDARAAVGEAARMGKRKGTSVALTKPISIWNKPLSLNIKELFKALGRGVAGGVTQNWSEVGLAGADAAVSLGLETKPEELAWELVFRSLVQAMRELVRELAETLTIQPVGDPEVLGETLKVALAEQELAIDSKFFERPEDFPLLRMIAPTFEEWLRKHDLPDAASRAVSGRLPSYFVQALHEEWGRRPEAYAKVKGAFDTPFTPAAERERAWHAYAARLNRSINERMLDEAFGLALVYVPPRAFFEQRVEEGKDRETEASRGILRDKVRRIVVQLNDELGAWVERGDKDDALRVICGGPGSGKSSFAKMFAAKLAAKGKRVLLVPMHRVDPQGDIADIVGKFVRDTECLPDNPLDQQRGEERVLLIFDGLDELSMQGKTGAERARWFLEEARRYVERRNHERLRVQILVEGREVAVQQGSDLLRKAGQVLTLLPYYVPEHERRREAYVDPKEFLAEDQRDAWWRGFAAATGGTYADMPEELYRQDLDEVTAQPLLGYLVARSYARGNIDFSKNVNRNLIYGDLLDEVYERAYAGRSPHPATRAFERRDFGRALEEIAVAAWHGNGRTATVAEIGTRLSLEGKFKQFVKDCEDRRGSGVMQLLLAFYFRQAGRTAGGDEAFEFTHKSFSEYLVALRIERLLIRMQGELERHEAGEGGWDEGDALRHWVTLCGPTAMDGSIHRFLCDQVTLAGAEKARIWQGMLARVIERMLRTGMPMQAISPRLLTFAEDVRQARNAEEALLASLCACARATQEVSEVKWPDPESAGAWIVRLLGQRGAGSRLVLDCLDWLDLALCILHSRDLVRANLQNATLVGAMLQGANLEGANLEGANLEGADLQRADLFRAHLVGADLEGANLFRAHLVGANLQGANLQRANLLGANLVGAMLQGANLQRANLKDADLTGARGLPPHLKPPSPGNPKLN
ncbi:pentapeptide repeat-containing protein [Polyangium sp. 6x1]|uniref:pentapeptide repeat-containing protein n=1 Tax=Polyangium sp. 6x1 TaxID=3042689 RepID=UPI0024822347|nr:pentapeptide repeat-containing protein [Polyangium sp. 6x1]MDI1447792.1 pentapeptide repeat-containing protein [Polyangium sp. 6x1]